MGRSRRPGLNRLPEDENLRDFVTSVAAAMHLESARWPKRAHKHEALTGNDYCFVAQAVVESLMRSGWRFEKGKRLPRSQVTFE